MAKAKWLTAVLRCKTCSKKGDLDAPLSFAELMDPEVLERHVARTAAKRKTAKWTTYCRVSFVFSDSHRGWMAMLLWRRALLVFVFIVASGSGSKFTLSSGIAIDDRVFAFLLLVAYVILQAHSQPFATDSEFS
jgi:hypothetical protein